MAFISQAITFFEQHRLLLNLSIIFAIWFCRYLIIISIRSDSNFLSDVQRKWIARTKNWSLIFMLASVFIIWRDEINHFALSLTAIAFALVVASKEIILCFTGSFQRASSGSFQIGDWIEVDKLCGEVIDQNLMATKIQEIDLKSGTYAYTGKIVTLPNSLFFTFPVKNLYFMKRYVYHEFSVITKANVNLHPLVEPLLVKINQHCEDFRDVATRYNLVIERHVGVDLPGADPLVCVSSGIYGDPIVNVRIFCPTERAIELEQLIKRDFMALYDEYILQTPTIIIPTAEE